MASAPARSFSRPAAPHSAPWIERFARLGYAAKAVLYGTVGALALRAALDRGRATGSSGALAVLLDNPLGGIALVVMAAGLFGYAAWRIVEAVLDPERKGSGAKGLAVRASWVGRGLIHAGLGVEAIRLTTGTPGSDGGQAQHWTSRALDAPFGTWLVAIAAASIVGYGVYQLYRAWQAKLSEHLDLSRLTREAGAWAVRVSRLGIAARGLVFLVVGGLIARAAAQRDPSQAGGVGEALRAIDTQPYVPGLLAGVAAGLIAYGLYEAIQARYRIIRPA